MRLARLLISTLLFITSIIIGSSVHAATQMTLYINDAQSSPVAALDKFGNVLWTERYQSYGQPQDQLTAAKAHPVGYTTHEFDRDSQLIYMGGRYYDAKLGRFLSVDPVEFTETNVFSFNRYAYANNNPYAFYDPDGRDAVGIVFQNYMVNTGIYNFKAPLGHAGVLLINNATGETKYFEFGRYDGNAAGVVGAKLPKDDGNIRNIPISNVVIGSDGKPTENSLNLIYGELSEKTGQNKAVESTYHSGADFNAMRSYVNSIANDKNRDKYSLVRNTCYDFKNRVIDAGNVKKTMVNK